MNQGTHYSQRGVGFYLFAALLVPGMLLAPALNIPVPGALRQLDVYISLILIVYLLWNGFPRALEAIVTTPVATLLALTALMLGLELFFSLGDVTGISLSLRSVATILAAVGCSLLLWHGREEGAVRLFFKIVIYCAITQGLVLWVSFFSPEFRDLMSVFLHREALAGGEHLVELRVPGFAASGGDGLSLNHGLLCMVAVMGIYYLYPMRSLKRSLFLAAVIFANTGSAFTGRSGLYLASLFIALIMLTYQDGKLRVLRVVYFFLFLGFMVLLLAIFSNEIGAFGLALRDEYGYEYPIVRLLEGFIAMSSEGGSGYEDKTVSVLLNDMFFFPKEPVRLLIGNNDFGQMPVNFIESDVGYVRMIHGFGLLGMLAFLVGVFLTPVWALYRYKGWLQGRVGGSGMQTAEVGYLAQVVLVILLFGAVSHWKIFYLSSRIYLFVFFVLLSLTYLEMKSIGKRLQARAGSVQTSSLES